MSISEKQTVVSEGRLDSAEALRLVIDTAIELLENRLPANVRIESALMVLKDA